MTGSGPAAPIVRAASQWLVGVLLALALMGLFVTIIALQLTSAGTGQRILGRAVAVLTDIDALLPKLQDDLREVADTAAGDTVRVPGFPIPVELTRQEAATIEGEELRQRLLDESARQVYEEGMDVLAAADPDANRDVELLSTAGAIDRGLGLISESRHTGFQIAAVVLGLISVLLAALLMVTVRSYGRLVAMGAAVLGAALPSLAAAVAIRFGFRAAQEEADPFVNDLLQLGVDAMWVPVRNYIALAALGAALLVLGLGLIWSSARWAGQTSVDTPTV